MIAFIFRRLVSGVLVLVASSFLIFTAVSLAGDPLAGLKINPLMSQVTLNQITKVKHLNDPVIVRYGYWVRDAVTHRFGTPLLTTQPIWKDLARVLPHTLQLVLLTEFIAIVVGVAIGVFSAIRQYSLFDYAATTFSFLGYATPAFWVALMLQIVVADVFLRWHTRLLYTSGLSSVGVHGGIPFLLDRLQHLVLPVTALSLLSIAQYSRYMRAAMLEVMNMDYVRTARAKGLNERAVTMRHGFRNALTPIITVSALNFGQLIGGSIIVESIFGLDGMGPYLLNNLLNLDIYPVMAWLMVTASMVLAFNFVADIACAYIDPRIRYE